MRLALAVPPSLDAALSTDAVRFGHAVSARGESGAALAAELVRTPAEVAIVAANALFLTEALLALCDARGIRMLAVVGSDAERRHATTLGLWELIDATAPWADYERLLRGEASVYDAGRHFRAGRATPRRAGTPRGRSRDDDDVIEAGGEHFAPALDPRRYDELPGGTRPDPGAAGRDTKDAPAGTIAAAAAGPARGAVIAVWGPSGAPGRTSLAIAIASELAAEGFSVALGDVDTHGASIAPALGMLDEAPGFAAACRLAGVDGLNTRELERIGQRYTGRGTPFWVLTGIGRPSRWPELSGERVDAVIEQCREWVDVTVLDTGSSLENDEELQSDVFAPRRNGATLAALAAADLVVAVGAADPVGLSRFLRAHLDLVDACTTDRIVVAMNRVRASAIGAGPARQVTQTLSRFGGIEAPVIIPNDPNAFDAAILAGITLAEAAPKSTARVAIQQLVRTRIIPSLGVAVPVRTVRRLFSR